MEGKSSTLPVFQSSSLPTFQSLVDLRINGTRQTGTVRKTKLPCYRLVGAVSNCADAVRLKTAPTGGQKCSFIFNIHHLMNS